MNCGWMRKRANRCWPLRLPALVLTPLILCCTAMAAEVPSRDAYAWRYALSVDTAAEFLAADVPLDLYLGVTDPGLRDAGVYNADGMAVPRIFDYPELPDNTTEHVTPLGLVPLYGSIGKAPEQLRLLMQQGASGTTLQLDTQTPAADPDSDPPQAPLTAYIVDLRDVDEPFDALAFDWPELANGFIGTVTVEHSNDLKNWRRLVQGSLADLHYADTHIEQKQLPLRRAADDYLRIRWRDMPSGWQLQGIAGIRNQQGPAARREWLELAPVETHENGREFVFDAGGYLPVDRVNLLLPGANVVVRASIRFRHDADDSWRNAHQGLFYHVSRAGHEVSSPAAELSRTRAGQWQVRIESGAINGTPVPNAEAGLRLQIGWRPERLLFVAQGPAPFELVSGRALDRLDGFPQETRLGDTAIFQLLQDAGEPGQATIGSRELLAGAPALSVGAAQNWRVALVWAALIGGVLLVGWLVLSLLREMKTSRP